MTTMASQITSISIVCSTVCSGAGQRKYQSSTSLAFVRGIHRWPVDSPHKGPVTQKMFTIWSMTSSWTRVLFYDCLSDCEMNEILAKMGNNHMEMGKHITCIHRDNDKQNKIEHNKTICIFYGICFITAWTHYDDVIMGAIASQITSLTIV